MAQADHLPIAIRVLITDARPRRSTNPRAAHAGIARFAEHSSPFSSTSHQKVHAEDVLASLSEHLSAIAAKPELNVPGCPNIRQIEASSGPERDWTGALQLIGDVMAWGVLMTPRLKLADRRHLIGGSDAGSSWEAMRAPSCDFGGKSVGRSSRRICQATSSSSSGPLRPSTSTGTGTNAIGTRLSKTSGAGRATPEPREGGRALQSEKIAACHDEESSLLCPSMRKTWRGYFRFGCRRFRSRRPSPPPFSSMNSIPARSNAARIASTAPRETSRRSFSKSTTVESPRSAAWASCDCVIPSSPRAARHWAGVIVSTFFVDTRPDVSYQ
jgi:hypothetical protein